MRTLQRTQSWSQRIVITLAALAALTGVTVAPTAGADVFNSCTISRCADARSANSTWQSKNYPGTRGWYSWPNGQCNFAGGTYNNYEGELPDGHRYREFDVFPRKCNAARDAYRIIVDLTSGYVYYSPNHYTDFYRL